MTDTPGWTRPGGDPPEGTQSEQPPAPPPPAYPGWSPQQPPPAWGGQQGGGWGGPPGGGWAGQPGPGWHTPQPAAVKPGVVPLRPLGVGEILDGAITSMRQNPRTMLGLSAIVAVLSQLLQVAAMWVLFRDLTGLEQLTAQPALDEVASVMAGTFTTAALTGLITFLATIILTGILTLVVSRAVLGESINGGAAWRLARPQLPRLIGLTMLVGLVVIAPVLLGALPGLLLGLAGADAGTTVMLTGLGVLVGLPFTVWLYVRLALSTPALMLESTTVGPTGSAAGPGTGGTRRATVPGAMRRSARLVAGAWWRMFGILLLVLLITALVQQVISIPATMVALFLGGFGSVDASATFTGLLLTALAGFVGLTITMPFTAAVTVLLYVDRRIRREGLDIELARAAGVAIPGRTDGPASMDHGGPDTRPLV